MDNDWTREFRDKMEDWQQPAPEGVWEAVSSEMGVANRRRPVRMILGWAGGVAAAAAVVAAFLFLGFGRGQVEGSDISIVRGFSGDVLAQVIAEGNDTEEAPGGDGKAFRTGGKEDFRTGGKKATEAVSEKGVSGDASEDILKGVTDEEGLNGMTEDGGLNGMTEEERQKGQVAEGRDVEERIEEKEKDILKEDAWDETAGDTQDKTVGDVWKEIVDESVKAGHSGRGKVRVGAAVSGGSGGNSHLDGYAGAVAATGMINTFGENPQADIMLFNRTREVSTDTKYFQPIKAGVSVKWNFAGRWGLESGLYWIGLYSRTTSGSDSYFTRSRQDLHYLGIPLNLTCDIWSGKGFTVYATAGGTMEKCVGGRVRTEYFYNNTPTEPVSSAISEKQLQWSAGVNFGAEYLFSKHIGLYLEPGAIWHFNNGSAIDNVFKARPFDFNIALGLRFAF